MKKVSFKHKPISPKTEKQKQVLESIRDMVLFGAAGTGKSFLALIAAMESVRLGEHRQVVIFRSGVSTRDPGFLPGNETEKGAVYEEPYKDLIDSLYGEGSYLKFKEHDIIKFKTTSFIRGLTIDNAVIIVEEAQNLDFHEFDSVLTRVGQYSRVIITGDNAQSDLKNSGFPKILKILQRMDEFDFFEFDIDDIVRSGFVKNYLLAKYAEESSTEQ